MSCNTKTSLAAVIDAVNAQLNNNYVDRDDPRIDQGVFTEPTIRGGLMLDEAAKLDFCGYVTECGQREPFGKHWVDRPLYPHNTLVSYDDGGEIKSRWQDIDDAVAGTEIGESYTAYEETRSLGLQGYTIIDSFELGATITQRNKALRHAETGKLYRWAGDLPKTVPAGSTPADSGGVGTNAWLDVSDIALRQEILTSGLLTVNRGLESVADLSTIKNPKDGLRVYVKSYHVGLNKGGGEFVYTGVEPLIINDVTHFNGWVRSSPLDIFSGGIKADGSDDTAAFQRTYEVFSDRNQVLDLKGLTIHISKLDLVNNSSIINGILDLTDYIAPTGWVDNWRRGPIMGKNSPRNSSDDFEYASIYTNLEWLTDVAFSNVTFLSKVNLTTLYKAKNMDWLGCKFYIEFGAAIQYIGGYHSTDLPDDGNDEFNLIQETINPRVRNIRIIDCVGVYTGELTATVLDYTTICRLIACEDVMIQNCTTTNMRIAIHADIYNRRVFINGGYFKFTEESFDYLNSNDLTDADVLGVYVGQNSHSYTIQNVKMLNVYRPVYIEGASKIDIINCTFTSNISHPSYNYGILIQANLRGPDRVKWANCKDILIRGCTLKGYSNCINVSSGESLYQVHARNIQILHNNLDSGNISAVVVTATANLKLAYNNCIGSLLLSGIGDHVVEHNNFNSVTNLALLVGGVQNLYLNNNVFEVSTGSLIRKLTDFDGTLFINGGVVSESPFLESGALISLQAVGYAIKNRMPSLLRQLITLPTGMGRYWVASTNMRPEWEVELTMQSESVYRGEHNWSFDYFAVCDVGGFWLYFNNQMPDTPLSFTPAFFVVEKPKYITL